MKNRIGIISGHSLLLSYVKQWHAWAEFDLNSNMTALWSGESRWLTCMKSQSHPTVAALKWLSGRERAWNVGQWPILGSPLHDQSEVCYRAVLRTIKWPCVRNGTAVRRERVHETGRCFSTLFRSYYKWIRWLLPPWLDYWVEYVTG